MEIIGPDDLLFGVADLAACRRFLSDYGLQETPGEEGAYRFEALDGTAMTLMAIDDARLPPPLPSGSTLRQTVWGCKNQEAVDEIAADLATDRELAYYVDGSFGCKDDLGFEIKFCVSRRRVLDDDPETVNSPGSAAARPANQLGCDGRVAARPRTLSHIVYFVPDFQKMEAFYVRLGFTVTDRFTGVGPFMRPRANDDHHCLFMIQTPAFMQGIEHIAFHMKGPTELMQAGHRLQGKGYESFWGPGRHNFGSNWFWYFNSPMGLHMEYDADMDKHDDLWLAREAPANEETSQLFLLEAVEKWYPNGKPA